MAGNSDDFSTSSDCSSDSDSSPPTLSDRKKSSTRGKSSTSHSKRRKHGHKESKKRRRRRGKKSKRISRHQYRTSSSSESNVSNTSSTPHSSKNKKLTGEAHLFNVYQKHNFIFLTMARSNLWILTSKLFSRNIISDDVQSEISSSHGSELEKASKLLHHVTNRIKLYPSKLLEFMEVLQEIPSLSDQAKEIMGR